MLRVDGRIGMRVTFGRSGGEKTLGEIVKINPKSFKVKQLEERGVRKVRGAGTIWTVAPGLCTIVTEPSPSKEGKISPNELVGKTILSIDSETINAWRIYFKDGTSVWIDTESGPAGIPGLVLYPVKD